MGVQISEIFRFAIRFQTFCVFMSHFYRNRKLRNGWKPFISRLSATKQPYPICPVSYKLLRLGRGVHLTIPPGGDTLPSVKAAMTEKHLRGGAQRGTQQLKVSCAERRAVPLLSCPGRPGRARPLQRSRAASCHAAPTRDTRLSDHSGLAASPLAPASVHPRWLRRLCASCKQGGTVGFSSHP